MPKTHFSPTWTVEQLTQRLERPQQEILEAIAEGELEAASFEPEICVTNEAVEASFGPLEQRHWRVEDGGGRIQIITAVSPADAFLKAAGFAELELSKHIPWSIPDRIDIREATKEDIRDYEDHGGEVS